MCQPLSTLFSNLQYDLSIYLIPLKQLKSSILQSISIYNHNSQTPLLDLFNLFTDYFGLSTLPNPQKYGILFGILVFSLTIITVIALLILGGSFRRIQEQECGDNEVTLKKTLPSIIQQRIERAFLYDDLLESRKRMLLKYQKNVYEGMTPIMDMLNSMSPKYYDKDKIVLPEGYEKEYVKGYLECQSKPGGENLSGIPEARYESYARAYAGCGINTTSTYKRSYARMYETTACATHRSEKMYRDHWKQYPYDIVGRTIRLEPLSIDRHLSTLFTITSGQKCGFNNSFDPYLIWAFFKEGPFSSVSELKKSTIFQKEENTASYAIVKIMTNKVVGIIMLTYDNPSNLSISLEPPIIIPSLDGTLEQVESCFLLLDRLFAHGYRRIQYSVDSMDMNSKRLAGKLEFTQEGMLSKDRINKDSNRDSIVYSMLNSDWNEGARGVLYEKLHGKRVRTVDERFIKKQEELDVQKDFILNHGKNKEELEKKEDIIQKIMWNYIQESVIIHEKN